MLSLINTIVWIMLIYHSLALVGRLLAGSWLKNSGMLFLRLAFDPDKTKRDAGNALIAIGKHTIWIIALWFLLTHLSV